MANFKVSTSEKGKTLTIIFDDGDIDTIPSDHINYQRILDSILDGENEDHIRELLSPIEAAVSHMTLSDRISFDGESLLLDGDEFPGELAEHIKASILDQKSSQMDALVAFLDKVATNPSIRSIDHLYRWVRKGDLTISKDGDFIAYKGVMDKGDGTLVSIHSGSARVDGKLVRGHIPNVPGSVITMPRSEVDDDQGVACSTGLHAGTYAYASSFARGHLILVKINPRDVVSVPTDSADQKLRVSRYEVLEAIPFTRLESGFYGDYQDNYDDEEYEEDDYSYPDDYEDEYPEDWDDELDEDKFYQ